MPLSELLQGVEFNGKTGRVEVEGEGVRGEILYQDGKPWDASTADGLAGDAAIARLLRIGRGAFAMRTEAPRPGTQRIRVSFTRLLLDASRETDESGREEEPTAQPAPAEPPLDDPEETASDSAKLSAQRDRSVSELRAALAALEAQQLPDPVGDPFLGVVLGPFSVDGYLGADRGERRYLATHTPDGGRCLLRVFPLFGPHEAEFRKLARRAEAVLHVEHPHLERCVAWGRTRDALFAGFEPPLGRPLAELVAEGPVPHERVLAIVEAVARALKALHRRSQTHGHVSLEAIRVEPDGAVALCGAGLGRPHPTVSFFAEGDVLGPPGTIAPETLDQGVLAPAGEVWALGCVAWTLLAGRPPFPPDLDLSALLERLHQGLPRVPAPPGGAPPPASVVALVQRMTAIDPRARYERAGDLIADVRACREGKPIAPPEAPAAAAAASGRRRAARRRASPWLLPAGALALCAALAAGAALTWRAGDAVELAPPIPEGFELPLPEDVLPPG